MSSQRPTERKLHYHALADLRRTQSFQLKLSFREHAGKVPNSHPEMRSKLEIAHKNITWHILTNWNPSLRVRIAKYGVFRLVWRNALWTLPFSPLRQVPFSSLGASNNSEALMHIWFQTDALNTTTDPSFSLAPVLTVS